MPEELLSQADSAPPNAVPQSESPQGGELAGADTAKADSVVSDEERLNDEAEQETKEQSERRRANMRRRFSELTQAKYEAKAEAEAARLYAKHLEERLNAVGEKPTSKQGTAQDADGPPRREQFDDIEEYWKAQNKWEVKNALREYEESRKRTEAEQTAQRTVADLTQRLHKAAADFAKTVPDYYETVDDPSVRVPMPATAAILKHVDAPAILYHIGKNPVIAQQLQQLDPMSQAIAIGDIAANLRAMRQKVTSAPDPGKPVAPRATVTKSLAELPWKEFVETRRKQIARRR